ncbi:hypothetical protein GCM10017674_17820 [Streptomyces gardneri]|uniref:Secreted protein n=1 Tax=Streptomyces gardneri TaxID=66892 RepID=A0A4Y3RAU9_9ACTN|nr:hypothetical protein SGA01_04760 [Streptomyces gardneri]GHG90246.1 hypothetical protein GCM10017674_17820 [Streptomyces gardneri]
MTESVAAMRLSLGPVAAFAWSGVAAMKPTVTAMAATAVVPASSGRRSRVVRVVVIDPSFSECCDKEADSGPPGPAGREHVRPER